MNDSDVSVGDGKKTRWRELLTGKVDRRGDRGKKSGGDIANGEGKEDNREKGIGGGVGQKKGE